MSLSVVISAYNEESKIQRTLKSISWADEIILVDNSSTDETPIISAKYTRKIFKRPNLPMLNINKNYGFTKATSDWILCLDADEVIPADLKLEIIRAISVNNNLVGYWIPRKNIIFGKWIEHGLWWPDKQLRLFKKGLARYPEKHVHEYIAPDGPTGEFSTPFLHYNYETISQYLHKMTDIYTQNEVDKLVSSGYQLNWTDALRFPLSDFVKIYFAQKCYKDGLHGLVLSILQAFYSFIVFARVWESQKFRKRDIQLPEISQEIKNSIKDVRYWERSAKINSSANLFKKLIYKLERKIL